MQINKTVDECVTEMGIGLLQCTVDDSLDDDNKKSATKWILAFLDYQDALMKKNQKARERSEYFMRINTCPAYYKGASVEFKNSNLLYNNIFTQKDLIDKTKHYSIPAVKDVISGFVKMFIKAFQDYNIAFTAGLIEDIEFLTYAINYHITRNFQKELSKIITVLSKILKTKIKLKSAKTEFCLIHTILKDNTDFINQMQQIQLTNFLYTLSDLYSNPFSLNSKWEKLVFPKIKLLNISMKQLFGDEKIDLYQEIWKDNILNPKNSNSIMHLFAYETYYLQGQGNHVYYEEIVLKKAIQDSKYWDVFIKYKKQNKINTKI